MTLSYRHPDYSANECDWQLCRDCYEGERAIKDAGAKYLKPTGGMVMDGYGTTGTKGDADYCGYRDRAVFSNYLKKAVLHYMGLLWHKEPTIELPKTMEYLRESCTHENEGILQLLRSMHEEMLVTGRLGLWGELPDAKTTEELLPYIAMYKAESIINWDAGEHGELDHQTLNMVVLNESGPQRIDVFSFQYTYQYRVLMLGEPTINEENQVALEGETGPIYTTGKFMDANVQWDPANMMTPLLRGKPLNVIPFVFVNSKHIQAKPDKPPQLDLANQDIHIYKGEADFRQALHMQAQPTLVLVGAQKPAPGSPEEAVRTGVGAVIYIDNPAGSASYIGVDPTGIPEMRTQLENDRRIADVMSGSLTDTRTNDAESGDAMGKRQAAESCRLVNIALNAANGLQAILRILAQWLGANPDEVKVTPNIDFSNIPLSPQDLLYLQQFATAGGPICDESIHKNVVRSGLSDMKYGDEMEKINTQEPRIALSGAPTNAPLDPMQQQQSDHADARLKMEQDAAKQAAADAKKQKPGAKK